MPSALFSYFIYHSKEKVFSSLFRAFEFVPFNQDTTNESSLYYYYCDIAEEKFSTRFNAYYINWGTDRRNSKYIVSWYVFFPG